MTYKYQSFIRNGGERRELASERADFISELRTMSEKTAERLMLRGDITNGADITIIESATGIIFEEYNWHQLEV